MKIKVIGSIYHLPENEQSGIKNAGIELGKNLAKNNISVILGALRPQVIDFYILKGMDQIEGNHKVIIYCTDTFVHEVEPEEFKNIHFVYKRFKGPWEISHIYGIKEADVVILIGGSQNLSKTAGFSTFAMEVPVIPIPSFGGAAKDIWDIAKERYINHKFGINNEEISQIQEKWNLKTIDSILSVSKKLTAKNPFKKAKILPQIILFVFLIILICLWIFLFQKGAKMIKENQYLFFILLGISSFLGTGLRTALNLGRNRNSVYEFADFLNEATTGFILSFAFALLYFASGIILTGDFVLLENVKDYTRVAITLSLVGLGTAFLLDDSVNNLKAKLTKVIKE